MVPKLGGNLRTRRVSQKYITVLYVSYTMNFTCITICVKKKKKISIYILINTAASNYTDTSFR